MGRARAAHLGPELRRPLVLDAALPLFAALSPSECDRLSRAAADIALVPGEFAVHEGADRALFAVLDGSIEPHALTGVAGVANTGSDRNWTAHDMSQANWYWPESRPSIRLDRRKPFSSS